MVQVGWVVKLRQRTENQMPHVPLDYIPAFLSITSQFVFKSSYSGLVENKS